MYSSSQADTATPAPSVGARSQANGRPSLRRHHSENKTTSGKERARPAPSRSSSVASEGTRRGGGGGSSGLDMQSLASILTSPNIPFLKALISTDNFASLTPEDQLALVRLLPECDQIMGPDNVLRMSQTALNNEFFSKSLTEWSEKATEVEFTLDKLSVGSSATSSRSAAGGGAAGDGGGEKDQARCESLRSSSSSGSSGVGSQLNGPNGCFAGSHNGGWTELCKAFRERHPREIPKAGPPFMPAPKVAVSKTKSKGRPAAAATVAAAAVTGGDEVGEVGRSAAGGADGVGCVGEGPAAESTVSTKMQAPELSRTISATPTDVASRVGDVASRVGDVAAAVVSAGGAASLARPGVGTSLASSANSPHPLAADARVARKRPPQLRPSRVRSALLGVGASLLRVANAGRVAAAAAAASASTDGGSAQPVALVGVGADPVVGTGPDVGADPVVGTDPAIGTVPAVCPDPSVGTDRAVGTDPAVGPKPAVISAAGPSGVVCNGVDGVRCRALSDTRVCAGSGGTSETAASSILASAAEKARRGDAYVAVHTQTLTAAAAAADTDTNACAEESLSRQTCSEELASAPVPVTIIAEALKRPVLISRDGHREMITAAGSCKRLRLCPQVSAAEAAAVAAATAAATAAAAAGLPLPPRVRGTSDVVAHGACDRPVAMTSTAITSVAAAAVGEATAALQSNGVMLSELGTFSGVSEWSITAPASGSSQPTEGVCSLVATSTGWASMTAASTSAEETLHQGQAKTLAQIKAMTRAKQMQKNSAQSVAASSAALGCSDAVAAATAAAVAGLPLSPQQFEQRGRARAGGSVLFFNSPGAPEGGVNLQRSLAICQASSSTPQTINYTRSYEICKEVLQKSNNTGMMSLLYKQQQQQHQVQQHQQQQLQYQLQQQPRHQSFSVNSCPSFAPAVADGTAITSFETVTSSMATVSPAALLGAANVRIKWPDPLPMNTEGATAVCTMPTETTPLMPTLPVDVASRVAVTNVDHVPDIAGSAIAGAASESTSRTLPALLPEPASSHLSSVLLVGQTGSRVTLATDRSADLCKVDEPSGRACTTVVLSQHSLPEQSAIGAVCRQLPSDSSNVACFSPCPALPAPAAALPLERNSSREADRERLAHLLKAKLQDRNLTHQPLVAVACGGGIYFRRRRKPVVASHPFLSMTDKEYVYSIKVHKKKVAVRPMKKHKVKGKKTGPHRTGSHSRTSNSALGILSDAAAAARSDSAASNEDWCTASDSSATKTEECGADSPAGETLAAATAAECVSSLATATSSSFASASVTAGGQTSLSGAEDAAGRLTPAFESSSDRLSLLHTEQDFTANPTRAAVRCGQARCLHQCQSAGGDLQPACTASSAAEDRDSRIAVAGGTSSAVRPPANCSCNLKAVRECPKCGAFSHEECCVTSNVCVSCLASI